MPHHLLRAKHLRSATFALLAGVAVAQQRAPMRCTVHDAHGQPLVGAEVVCVQGDQPTPGGADRRSARTGDDGTCALELLVGHGYWLWVIGPRDSGGNRLVVPPGQIAAAGRALELQAVLQLPPVVLDVRGAAEWLGDDLGGGPLALRLGIAPDIALGPDIPLPGDGGVQLPPLPDTRFVAALVDGRGGVVASLSIDARVTTVAQFPTTHAFEIEVTDEDGHALPGAQVLRLGQQALPAADGRRNTHRWSPVAAVCDAKGRARCRVADGDIQLFAAMHDGHTAMVSGWHLGVRFENDQPRGRDSDPTATLAFALPKTAPTTLHVRGAETGEPLTVELYDFRLLRTGRRSVPALMQFPAEAAADGAFAACGPSLGSTRVGLVTSLRQAPVPRRTHAETRPGARTLQFDELDLTALRTLRVQVVDDDDAPVAGARVDARLLGRHQAASECDVHTDRDGHAELRMASAGLALHATTTDRYGVALAPLGDDQPLRIVLRPMATAQLRIVDARGEPVVGARVEAQGRVEVRDANADSEAGERADFAAGEHAAAAFAVARSGPDGRMTVRCVDGGDTAHVMLTAVHGLRRGEAVELRFRHDARDDDGLQTLTLPDAPR